LADQVTAPLGLLKYLYVGSKSFDADLAYYRDVVGAEVVWSFHRFGAHVAALRLGDGPLWLIADHRPAPSAMPVFAVADLESVVAGLRARGWAPKAGPFEIPDGPCYTFEDPSGNELAVFGDVRPDMLMRASRG
jgi:predicted enzyme related to lactoylglutathione lyase